MNKHLLLTVSAVALTLVSCQHSDFEGYTRNENGMHYKFFNHDEAGPVLKEGDGVGISFTFKKQSNDSMLGSSVQVSRDGSGIIRYVMPKSSFSGSLEEGMMMMTKGDSASFIISADSFYLKNQKMPSLPPFIKPGEHLTVNIKIVDQKSPKELQELQQKQQAEMAKQAEEMQSQEKPAIDKYIADNKITAKPTESGLYYVESKKGKGPNAKAGDTVSVHYIGTLLNGEEFDNSVKRGEPIKFALGAGMVIPGWEQGLMMMNKGAKAKLIIPSGLAYGPQGNRGIPPFAPLSFEVEMVDIKPGK